jgi:hypothetical protein
VNHVALGKLDYSALGRVCGFAPRAAKRGSQDSNLEPPVLETGTLPLSYCPSKPIVASG